MAVKRWALRIAIASVGVVAGACMSSGIVTLSTDTYRLSRVDGGGRYADAAAMKASVIDDANAFARSRGKIAVPISTREETMRAGHLSTIDYDFRLVAPGESAPSPAPAAQQADGMTNPAGHGSTDGPAPSQTAELQPAGKAEAKPDLYTELIKLDDLRKRGILTEEEFQALKAKLLARQ
jgi:hypothetical protein